MSLLPVVVILSLVTVWLAAVYVTRRQSSGSGVDVGERDLDISTPRRRRS